jgi:hypothetical protein
LTPCGWRCRPQRPTFMGQLVIGRPAPFRTGWGRGEGAFCPSFIGAAACFFGGRDHSRTNLKMILREQSASAQGVVVCDVGTSSACCGRLIGSEIILRAHAHWYEAMTTTHKSLRLRSNQMLPAAHQSEGKINAFEGGFLRAPQHDAARKWQVAAASFPLRSGPCGK